MTATQLDLLDEGCCRCQNLPADRECVCARLFADLDACESRWSHAVADPTEEGQPMSADMTDDLIADAKELLTMNGYVVLREKSYRQAQERQRCAESFARMEAERRASSEVWARNCLAEERYMRDRLAFVYGVARAHGATVEELGGSMEQNPRGYIRVEMPDEAAG